MRITFWRFFIFLGVLVAIQYLINPYATDTYDPRARILGYMPYSIPSASMAPTLKRGDYIFVKTFVYMKASPERGDVIVFNFTNRGEKDIPYIKRVIAKGGDRVSIKNEVAIVNGQALTENYIQMVAGYNNHGDYKEVMVPENMFFVLGDNRNNSHDSRYIGFVDRKDIIGKATHIWMSHDFDRISEIK